MPQPGRHPANLLQRMKKKAIPPFSLTAGQSGRLLFNFTLPEGAETPALRGALMVHGERVDMEGTQEDMLTIPALPAGVYLAEVRAAGVCVLYGHVEVLPSPLFSEEGLATYRVDVDNTGVLQGNITMLEGMPGPQGLSAYDVARQNGFVGTESEWLESLKVDAQDAASAAAYRAQTLAEVSAINAMDARDDAWRGAALAELHAVNALDGAAANGEEVTA